MKRLVRPLIIAALVAVAAFGAASLSSDSTSENNTNTNENETVSVDGGQEAEEAKTDEKAEDKKPAETSDEAKEEEPAEQESEESTDGENGVRSEFSYVAQSGDSFSKVARKAVQTYGINNNVSLSQAQIVAAETFLTSDAGFPSLNLGQAVELNADDVKAAVEKASNLTDSQQALWQKYVPGVDFNTDAVGQA